jgi:hypothetical protein
MSKVKKKLPALLIIISLVALLSAVYLALGHKKVDAPTQNQPQTQESQTSPTPKFAGTDDILKNALNLYLEKKREGTDMENGPCLGKIADDWVLDIAHNPRQPGDNKPQNQCQDFIEGKVHHFIELDPDGKLIRSN